MALETASQDNTLDHLGDLYLVLDVPDHEAVGYVENPDVGIDFFLLKQEAIENHIGLSTTYDNQSHDGGDKEASGVTEYRFRVSSRHLCLASEYFRIMLEGPWNESVGTRQNPGVVRITSYKNPTAFLLLMKILHGFYAAVPRIVPAAVLGDLILMADFFQCLDKVAMFATVWLNEATPREYVRFEENWAASHHQYLLAAWVFEHEDAMELAIQATIIHNPGPILSFLPFLPQNFIDHLNHWRDTAIAKIRQDMNSMLVGINRAMPTSPDPEFTPLPTSMDGNWEPFPWEQPSEYPHERTYMQFFNCAREILRAVRMFAHVYGRDEHGHVTQRGYRVRAQYRPIDAVNGYSYLAREYHWNFHGGIPSQPHNRGWVLR